MFICVPKVGGETTSPPLPFLKGGLMAEVIDFEDLKKDSGDLKKLEDSELQKLSNNIQKLLDLDKTIEELEETIKEFKRERAIVSEETIPQQMQELGISDTTMADGSKITIKEGFHCRIPKDKIEQAHAYLRQEDLGDIIKNQVITSFGTGEDNMAGDLAGHIQDAYGITPDVKESVHPSTLKATLKKRHEEGLSDPDDLFGIFIRPETKITKGKKQ
jgi:glutamyl/glutaminyl-tRNA synthetase